MSETVIVGLFGLACLLFLAASAVPAREPRAPTKVHLVINWDEKVVEAYRASSYAGWAWEGRVGDLEDSLRASIGADRIDGDEWDDPTTDEIRYQAELRWDMVTVEVKP